MNQNAYVLKFIFLFFVALSIFFSQNYVNAQFNYSSPACISAPLEEHFQIAKKHIATNHTFYRVDKNSHKSVGSCNSLNTQSSVFQVKNIFNLYVGEVIVNGDNNSAKFKEYSPLPVRSTFGIIFFIGEILLLVIILTLAITHIYKKRKEKINKTSHNTAISGSRKVP